MLFAKSSSFVFCLWLKFDFLHAVAHKYSKHCFDIKSFDIDIFDIYTFGIFSPKFECIHYHILFKYEGFEHF